jgi:hypothetical protein
MKYLLCLMFPFLIVLSCSEQKKATTTTYHREIPYPKSDLIESFEWTAKPYKYPGTGSDMHWWTWGIDDAIYVWMTMVRTLEGL